MEEERTHRVKWRLKDDESDVSYLSKQVFTEKQAKKLTKSANALFRRAYHTVVMADGSPAKRKRNIPVKQSRRKKNGVKV